MASESDPDTGPAAPETSQTPSHPALSAAGNAVMGAAGEAAAFLAGAPIAGAADAAIGLGEVVSDRETRLEDAIAGDHRVQADTSAGASRTWLWLLLAAAIVAVLVWLSQSAYQVHH